MWFYETLFPDIKLGMQGELIYKTKTKFQLLKVYDTSRFGKVLVLDGAIQTTEKDEFIYHEMMTHPALFVHPRPQSVLVIGAGDGGIVREVLRHPVKDVTMVEIDSEVIEVSKKYFPSIHKKAFNDKRLTVVIDDGAAFVRQTDKKFDSVIIDSPDPVGPAKVLFSKKFYKNIYNVLKPNGVMIRQTGSTMLQPDEIKATVKALEGVFSFVAPHVFAVPTYIGGFFSAVIACKDMDINELTLNRISRRFKKLKLKTKYYTPLLHQASAVLPAYLEDKVR